MPGWTHLTIKGEVLFLSVSAGEVCEVRLAADQPPFGRFGLVSVSVSVYLIDLNTYIQNMLKCSHICLYFLNSVFEQ